MSPVELYAWIEKRNSKTGCCESLVTTQTNSMPFSALIKPIVGKQRHSPDALCKLSRHLVDEKWDVVILWGEAIVRKVLPNQEVKKTAYKNNM